MVCDEFRNPGIKGICYCRIIRFDIGQGDCGIAEPALLDLRLVVVVRDEVFRVEIRLLRERREEGEVWGVGRGAHVVDDYVEHEALYMPRECREPLRFLGSSAVPK